VLFRISRTGKGYYFGEHKIISNALLTLTHLLQSYAFCSDTAFLRENCFLESGMWMCCIHEAPFWRRKKKLAPKQKHAPAKEAATIAKEANVGLLIIRSFFYLDSKFMDLLRKKPKNHICGMWTCRRRQGV